MPVAKSEWRDRRVKAPLGKRTRDCEPPSRCSHDAFILQLLASADEDFKDIAECIVLGECELAVALSKIERALVQIEDRHQNSAHLSAFRLYQKRIDNALRELRNSVPK